MLNLEKKYKITPAITNSPNLCDILTESDLRQVGNFVYDNYKADVQSRQKWIVRSEAALDLAMQIQKDKSFPWPGCSNVAFPLVTIAALQFHSRSYPALIDTPNVVQMKVVGNDPDGSKLARAERVQDYMNWQLTEEDCDWEEQMDRALLSVPIVGTGFKKTYFNGEKGHNDSDFVQAKDLIINYWAKDINDCTKTHVLQFSTNKIHSRILNGTFRDVRESAWFKEGAPLPPTTLQTAAEDNRDGTNPTQADARTPYILLEQHCDLDLDSDGYSEPYIVTIEESSQEVLRVVARWNTESDIERNRDNNIICIKGTEYFTKIPFLPSPDGSIMDVGFGMLLGPLNESVNTAINQLFDSGTMSNTAGGFLGRGAKIRGGTYNFSPFSWNRVDSTGDDLRKSVIPLPVRDPSNVMFSLLSLLIEYTERVSGSVDISTGGNPGQNTPAQTSQTMIEQGQKVYSAIFKRIWRSLKEELRKWYTLNGLHMSPNGTLFAGSMDNIKKSDFLEDPTSIYPAADPHIMSDQQRFMQANALMQVGRGNPLFDQDQVYLTYLKSLKIPNIGQVFLGMEKMKQLAPPEKVQIAQMKAQVQLQELQWKKLQYISSLLEQRRLNEAKIINLYAQAALAQEQAGGVKAGTQIQAFQTLIDSIKTINDGITQQVQDLNNGQDEGGTPAGAGIQSLAGTPGFPEVSQMAQQQAAQPGA